MHDLLLFIYPAAAGALQLQRDKHKEVILIRYTKTLEIVLQKKNISI
jgi:hypothetical protein